MKKIVILLSFVFMVVALTGCSLIKAPNLESQISDLDVETNSIFMVEEEMDESLAELDVLNFSSTDDLDAEFENTLSDELQIDEEFDELESMDF